MFVSTARNFHVNSTITIFRMEDYPTLNFRVLLCYDYLVRFTGSRLTIFPKIISGNSSNDKRYHPKNSFFHRVGMCLLFIECPVDPVFHILNHQSLVLKIGAFFYYLMVLLFSLL